MGPGPPPQTEVPGVIEFVADPEALATILSGEGVKNCQLGRQPSLAQRVLVRGNQGGTIRRGQVINKTGYEEIKLGWEKAEAPGTLAWLVNLSCNSGPKRLI